MAIQESTSPTVERSVYEERAALVNATAYEIQLASTALQKMIESMDECGAIYPVTRGALLRFIDLTEAINMALADGGPTDPNMLTEANQMVYGKGVAHG
jgi:hypothetical protein